MERPKSSAESPTGPPPTYAPALELLNEVGLDALTTRRLAQRLGVESATLYWHFRDKAALLDAMAATAVARHHVIETPRATDQWLDWFVDNTRSFGRALLAYRDGARLHAGTMPGRDDLARLAPKMDYLVRVGFAEREALMALLTASQFTVGCVLEEQARDQRATPDPPTSVHPRIEAGADALAGEIVEVSRMGSGVAFEFGLGLILDGLRRRIETGASSG